MRKSKKNPRIFYCHFPHLPREVLSVPLITEHRLKSLTMFFQRLESRLVRFRDRYGVQGNGSACLTFALSLQNILEVGKKKKKKPS